MKVSKAKSKAAPGRPKRMFATKAPSEADAALGIAALALASGLKRIGQVLLDGTATDADREAVRMHVRTDKGIPLPDGLGRNRAGFAWVMALAFEKWIEQARQSGGASWLRAQAVQVDARLAKLPARDFAHALRDGRALSNACALLRTAGIPVDQQQARNHKSNARRAGVWVE
jgi:hypothetical protein